MSSTTLTAVLQDTLAIFKSPGEPLTTSEVAECLEVGRRATYARLEQLVEENYLKTKEVGASARVWWQPQNASAGTSNLEQSLSEDDKQGRSYYATLFEQSKDVTIVVEPDGTFRDFTPSVSNVFGYEREELVGEISFEYIHPNDREKAMAEFTKMLETSGYEPEFEFRFKHGDGTCVVIEAFARDLREDPNIEGIAIYTRDITERKEQEKELERYAGIVDAVNEPVYELDTQGRFTFINDAAVEQSGYDEAELLGQHVSVGMNEEAIVQSEAKIRELLADGSEGTATLEYNIITKDGEKIPVENRLSLLTDEDGQVRGSAGVLRDIAEREERKQELARFKRAVEAAGHGIYMTTPDGRITYVNSAFEETTSFSHEEAIGQTPAILDSGEHNDAYFDQLWNTITAGKQWEEEIVNQQKTGELYTAHQIISPVEGNTGDIDHFVAIQTDITERKKRERELETRIRQQEVVAELSQSALENRDLDALMADAAELVAETLDNDYCKILDLDAGMEKLLLRQGVGWHEGIVGEATVSAVENGSQAAFTLANEHPIVVENLDTDSRFSGPDLLTSHDVKSGISVSIGRKNDPWGILGTHDANQKTFTEHDVTFVQSVANILATAINRHQDEQELIHQRQELATLNNLNTIVSEITDTIIGKSTLEEIEQAVCDTLAATDSYEFAWLAGIDNQQETFDPRATARTKGYAEELTISLDPNKPSGQGPGATAIRAQEIQVIRDVFSEPKFKPWREIAAEYGFSSLAAIPIVHEDTVYGVLAVYADRPNAFDTAEQTIISRLGEVVGHAIASIERKHALLSEEVIEFTFLVRDVFKQLDIPSPPKGTITIKELVSIQDDEFLIYGIATADAREGMKRIREGLSRWKSVTFYETEGDTRFEAHLSKHPVISIIASLGGSLEEAVIESGDYRLTVDLPPNADVRQLIDTVEESYPGVEMITRRQTTRANKQDKSNDNIIAELTDRQQATLQSAYHSGFFECPRDSSGEDVADSLGIAPATFHHHLRKAEKKVVRSVLSVETE